MKMTTEYIFLVLRENAAIDMHFFPYICVLIFFNTASMCCKHNLFATSCVSYCLKLSCNVIYTKVRHFSGRLYSGAVYSLA